MNKHAKGWKRAKEMRKWRDRKGGRRGRNPHDYLKSALGEEMEDWLRDQWKKGLRPSSIEGRLYHIRLFLKWCWQQDVTRPEWISKGLMEAWLLSVDEHLTRNGTPYTDNSKESLIRSVYAFLCYLLLHRRIDSNPLAGIRLRRCRGRSMPIILDEAQVLRLLEIPDTTDVLGLRDRAMLEVTYSSGLRRTEITGLREDDFCQGGTAVMVRNGKGGKQRVVPLGTQAQHWLKRYLTEARPKQIVTGAPSKMMFLTSYGDGFSSGGWGQVVRRYLYRAEVKAKGGPASSTSCLRYPYVGSRCGLADDTNTSRPFAGGYD